MMNPIMQFFKYDHLPSNPQTISSACAQLAAEMDSNLPDCAEKSAGLRKLLEAKDCFVRASMPKQTALEETQEAAKQGFNS